MAKSIHHKRVLCIGGGTGTFVVLRGLKKYPYRLSAIVPISDSGGSNKRIRDEFGLLPTSDIRQCFVALSDENGGIGLLRKLFMYRYEKGKGISGMTFGNLFMAALSDILGSQEEAIRQTGKVLRIHGSVIPVSLSKTDLVAEYENGEFITEEHFIDEPPHDGTIPIRSIRLNPPVEANSEALTAIRDAHLIIIGPGDLYTSIIPNLLVDGMSQALRRSKGKIVYIMNLMTKFGQTYNYTAHDHVSAIEKFIGSAIDFIIVNTKKPSQKALRMYKKQCESPVADDLRSDSHYEVFRSPLISNTIIDTSASDILVRSLIRHDSDLLAKVLVSLLERAQ